MTDDAHRQARGKQAPDPAGASDLNTQSIDAVVDFYAREEEGITASQRALERTSHHLGQPAFLGAIIALVSLWILANLLLVILGRSAFDPFPYASLQGIVGLSALITASIVLIRQNRLARLAEQRAHLDLQVTLLTEQKVAKLIHLVEELRQDLPNVPNRHDAGAVAMQESMSPGTVLAALDAGKLP